jgi:carboxyl-terminal processing protease
MTSFQRYLRIYLPLILALVLVTGIYLGTILSRQNSRVLIHPQPNKLNSVINYIAEEYVDTVNKKDLIEKTIPLVVQNLDPHSVYIPARDHERVNEPLVGNFEGIGVQFKIQYDTIAVVKAIINGPSYNVGVMDGDRIIKINDSLVAGVGISETQVMKILRGEKGTKVNISILRRGSDELIDFTITRDKIPLYSVDAAIMVNETTAYIKISTFAQTTYQEFREAVLDLNEQNVENIIIDLRGNSGGYLDAATNIADEFLKEGKLIVYTEGRSRPKQNIVATGRGLCEEDNVVVILDEWSASASEILAGALQDNDRGVIVGRRSFGKGLVQESIRFRDGSSLRLTIARYFTPTGRSIQKPYDNGIQDYNNDIGMRYFHGEFEQKDSIEFVDSLKFYTPNGNVVYGGGGIMPDHFVAIDTTGTSNYLTRVSRKGLLYHFAFEYADKNRKSLIEFDTADEIYNYLKQNNVLSDFVVYAQENGVESNEEDIQISKTILETQLYALITRNILDNEGFYPILLRIDKTFQKALKVLQS